VTPPLRFRRGVTLVGGGGPARACFERARALAPHVVAADGAADILAGWGEGAEAVIGDMDSLAEPARWVGRLVPVAEQETTDLEKCLYSVEAPFFLGVGFIGRRFDHTLAAMHALLARPGKRLLLIGEDDVTFLAPPRWRARLEPRARVSIFPLRPVVGLRSEGLVWPLRDLPLEVGARIGTSNAAGAGEVAVEFDRPGAVIMVERRFLEAALASLVGPEAPL
jgi:thiamine pyrophosphokinase